MVVGALKKAFIRHSLFSEKSEVPTRETRGVGWVGGGWGTCVLRPFLEMARVYSWPSRDASHVGKSFVLMIFIVLPNFAVCSRAVSRGILISLSQLVLQQYVGIVCAIALQPLPLPSEKVGLIWPNPHTVS